MKTIMKKNNILTINKKLNINKILHLRRKVV
jgi:hypothetical protein